MKYPAIVKHEYVTDSSVVLYTASLKGIAWFEGHFPEIKVFPAVGTMNMVAYFFKEYLHVDINSSLEVIPQAKFIKPILENSCLKITLTLNLPGEASFEVADSKNGTLYSVGKFKLA